MNYLAHAYLSFNQREILVGNMISDFVKGKKKFDYPILVQKGIILHRAIDEFTDEHTTTKKAKQIFHADYRLYAGAFVDVVYDHFLAIDEKEFTNESLKEFTQKTYQSLSQFVDIFPDRFQNRHGSSAPPVHGLPEPAALHDRTLPASAHRGSVPGRRQPADLRTCFHR